MSDETPMGQVIQIDEARIRDHLGEMVRGTVEETLNALLDAEADRLCGAGRYERIMKEIRRRTRVVGAFPDGQSCLNLAAARLRYITGTAWSAKCYMNMRPLYQPHVFQTEAVA